MRRLSPRLCAVAALLLVALFSSYEAKGALPRIIDNSNHTFILHDEENQICLYASFKMNFMVIYTTGNETYQQVESSEFHLPPKERMDHVGGECNRSLDLRWTNDNGTKLGVAMNFTTDKNNHWTIKRVAFSFVIDNSSFTMPIDIDLYHVYQTSHNSSNLLNRTYSLNQYFYCERCKTFYLTELGENSDRDSLSEPCHNTTGCSTIEMMKAVIYPGDVEREGLKKFICIEDYIALQEIIVPVVVGGILSFLLVVIFFSYLIAYFRRKSRESRQYEPVSDDKF